MTTFRARLTKALAIFTAAFLSLFCLALYLWCRSAFLADLDGDLEAIFRADFASHVDSQTTADHRHEGGQHEEFGEFEVFKLLVDREGRVVKSAAAKPPQLELSPESLRRVIEHGKTFATLSSDQELFRTLLSPVKVGDTTMVEVIGISQNPMLESLEELERALGLSLLLGIGLVTLISTRVAQYLTRPLEDILRQLESAGEGDADLRIKGRYSEVEMASLQREVNGMLERLEQSFRAQQRFVSDASHELRAPLANLTLAIEVCLRRPRTPEEYLEALKTCHGETRRLSEMATQLLTLGKSDEGGLALVREPVSIAALLQGCLERAGAQAANREVRLELSASDLTATVDPLKLSRVVDNLLDNAIRHSPTGQPVEVNASVARDTLVIKVRDFGPGMSQEQMARIFERFYRADPSRQRGTGGAGLGLSICKALVEAHGGKVSLESTPGQGTTVTIRIPLDEPPAPEYSPTLGPS